MKALDLAGIALRTLRSRWAALPAAGFAAGAFCLCFAGAILTTVQQEQSQPCEMEVTARSNAALSAGDVADLLAIPGVTGASPLLKVPVTVRSGDYAAELTLTGVDAAYLDGEFARGAVFPDGAMPRMVLNEAACRLFSDGQQAPGDGLPSPGDELPPIDWLNAGFAVQAGEGTRPVVSAVCGILAGGDGQEPAAYVSLRAAKELLRMGGRSAESTAAGVRVVNVGQASGVARAAAALGFDVGEYDGELQARWEGMLGEMRYLLFAGLFSLLCASALLSAWRRVTLAEQRESWGMLRWLGMGAREINGLLGLRSLLAALLGVAAGVIAALALPSFLPGEMSGTSVFTLAVPPGVAALCAAACLIAGLLSNPFTTISRRET